MLDQLDQMQASTPVALLSALLEHPDFQRGLALAQEAFADSYEQAPLTDAEMIVEVELNLSRDVTERSKEISRIMGWGAPSYLYTLGYVVGTINQGLTYAR